MKYIQNIPGILYKIDREGYAPVSFEYLYYDENYDTHNQEYYNNET